jgi:putative hydrolase of the HAD superfamily
MKIISFDLDGTLTTPEFVDSVWRVGIPRLYGEKNNIAFLQAQQIIFHEYDVMGDDDLKWYDLPFWLNYLRLEVSTEQLLAAFSNLISLFPDVLSTLSMLQQRYPLIIISNANRMFLDREINVTGIGKFFKKIFSATSDFGRVKREEDIYQRVSDLIRVLPSDIVHVGDHREFDFEAPQRIGMQAYFLDRSSNETGPQVIHSLDELTTIT